jgi:hypothetical protein
MNWKLTRGVHDSVELEESEENPNGERTVDEQREEESDEEVSDTGPLTSTPRQIREESIGFGTATARYIHIARAAGGEDSAFRFTGSAREHNRAKARRLFARSLESNVPVEAPTKGGRGGGGKGKRESLNLWTMAHL